MQQLKQLKRNSLHLHDGLPVRWPSMEHSGKFNVGSTIKRLKCEKAYNCGAGLTAFVDCGEMYVTPFGDAVETLEANGFVWVNNLHIPFSHGDLPQGNFLKKWENLLHKAISAEESRPPELAVTPA